MLITGPIAGPIKLARLTALRQIADPIVVVDHLDHVQLLSQAGFQHHAPLRVLIEIDLGMRRCGVPPGSAAVALAHEIARHPTLAFAGMMGWEGHLLTIDDPAEKRQRIAEAIDGLETTRQALIASGIPCPIVSAGGTGSFPITGTLGVATELEAGGAIFMDLFYRNKCHIEGMDFALTVLTTVISRPEATRAVIDAGRKTLSPDLHLPAVKDRADLNVQWLSAEHGILGVQESASLSIGDKLELIPGYGDWTTVLHDHYFVFRGNRLEAIWPLEARSRND
jgi:D-serine deaminase-like pyridoxal phosphate-dependent protein